MIGTDRVKWAVGALAIAAVVAGCGRSGSVDRVAVQIALTRSEWSYFHYQAPIWTGHGLNLKLGTVKSSGDFAVARVSLAVGRPGARTQWTLLRRQNSRWRAIASVNGRASYLPCRAPRSVMKKIAGGCSGPGVDLGGYISGPRAIRPPTAAERLRIVAAAKRAFGLYGHDSCITYSAAVSTINHRYARIDFAFHKPYGNCHLFNDIDLVKKTSTGWKLINESSVSFACENAPPGVVRSLYGQCATIRG